MTTRPRLADFDRGAAAGLAAVALFGLFTAVFLTATFDQPDGFGAGAALVKGIGFAMFDIDAGVASEGFLATFEIVDIVLVAALVGSVMLARREEGGVLELVTDGGRPDGTDDEAASADPGDADAPAAEGGED